MTIDRNDGKPWSAMDEADLLAALERGESIEDAATFLCRRGTLAEVAWKAQKIGLLDAERLPKVRSR